MRPQTIDDLTDEQREGAEFFRIDTGNLPADGQVITAVGKLITRARTAAAATGAIHVSRSKHGDVTGRLVPTTEELEQKLKSAQETWDYFEHQYEACLLGTKPSSAYGLTQWCKAEGRALPWETDTEAADR